VEVEVRFQPSGKVVRVPYGTTLLEAAEQAGLPVASACGSDGICGRCGMTILVGAASLSPETENETHVKRLNRIDASQRLSCNAEVSGDVEVTATYW
jgi:2Fe-2S ferredoxin